LNAAANLERCLQEHREVANDSINAVIEKSEAASEGFDENEKRPSGRLRF
jgi:hypothetical protein